MSNLSIEQQFAIRSFQAQVERMSREQAQELLKKMYTRMIICENQYKELAKHKWRGGNAT